MLANISTRSFPVNVRLSLLACNSIIYLKREHAQPTAYLKQPKCK